jgi:hypothetical protein
VLSTPALSCVAEAAANAQAVGAGDATATAEAVSGLTGRDVATSWMLICPAVRSVFEALVQRSNAFIAAQQSVASVECVLAQVPFALQSVGESSAAL